MSATSLALVTLVIPDYDQAAAFFTKVLDFALIEDSDLGEGKRWVVVGGQTGGRILLAKAKGDEQHAAIGNQFGGRVGLFLQTDDFAATHRKLSDAGISFEESPRRESYGTVAVFSDPFGNRWDLIEYEKTA
ncbi:MULTISPECIES: VOC family protein [Erythrobacter]|uniref:VOC family protein n=1 Tax=Erythrobacter TaxID=1041 RepID=UPI001EEFF77E|nr:VOC family protein [Erythrobacter aureus]MCF8883700.1 VOC family protein [Erythrobacter sp. SN021]